MLSSPRGHPATSKSAFTRVFDALCAGTTVGSDGEAIAESRITRVPYSRPSPAGGGPRVHPLRLERGTHRRGWIAGSRQSSPAMTVGELWPSRPWPTSAFDFSLRLQPSTSAFDLGSHNY